MQYFEKTTETECHPGNFDILAYLSCTNPNLVYYVGWMVCDFCKTAIFVATFDLLSLHYCPSFHIPSPLSV